MTDPQFNPPKIYNDARSWMASSKQVIFDRACETIRAFADGKELEFGLVDLSASFHDLAIWYEMAFIAEANEGLDTAADSLSLSFDYNFWEALTITRHWSPLAEIPFGKGLDDYVLYLSKGLSIGAFKDAIALGWLILHNRKKRGWFTSNGNAVTNFVLGLFCRSQGGDCSEYSANTRHEFYRSLIDKLFESDGNALESYLRDACDFHVEQSRDLTEREHPAFDQPFSRVYPSEILAVLSLRRNAGLPNPPIDHDLLLLPTSQILYATDARDDLFTSVKKKLIVNFQVDEYLTDATFTELSFRD